MTVLTIDKITATVGASVAGVDRYQLLEDEAFPTQVHEALEANGALVFRREHASSIATLRRTAARCSPLSVQSPRRRRLPEV